MTQLQTKATSPQIITVQFGPLTLVGLMDDTGVIWINFKRACEEFRVSFDSQRKRANQVVGESNSVTAFFTATGPDGKSYSMLHLKVEDFSEWLMGLSIGPLDEEIKPVVEGIKKAGRDALEAKFFGTKDSQVHVPSQAQLETETQQALISEELAKLLTSLNSKIDSLQSEVRESKYGYSALPEGVIEIVETDPLEIAKRISTQIQPEVERILISEGMSSSAAKKRAASQINGVARRYSKNGKSARNRWTLEDCQAVANFVEHTYLISTDHIFKTRLYKESIPTPIYEVFNNPLKKFLK